MKGDEGGQSPGFETDDLYALLNVSRNASVTEIQRSYKKLSRVYHPDKLSVRARASGIEDAQQTFVAVKQAHDVLSDPIYRLAYDFGGLLAVTLVKRSQAAAHSQKQAAARAEGRNKSGDEENEEEDDDFARVDLYSELQRSPGHAAILLQQALNEYYWHQGAATRMHMTAGIDMPHIYWNSNYTASRFEREGSSLQFQSRRPLSPHSTVVLGASSSVQSTAETDVNATGGLEIRPSRGTQVNVDVMLHPRSSVPQLSFRTSRQMSNGNFFMATLSGRPFASQTWSYSFISYRTLLWESAASRMGSRPQENHGARDRHQQEVSKLQASWRLGVRPAARQIAFIMASIKTTTFPQWAGRLAVGNTYPLKITYQTDQETEGTPYLSLSTSGLYSRFKMAWLQRLDFLEGNWTFKYGIKYDGRALFIGESPWTALFQLYSDEWTLRIPINLLCTASIWPVASLLTLLISQWLDQELDRWTSAGKNHDNHYNSFWDETRSANNKPLRAPPVFPEVISRIAAKKRQLELETDGLVILHARWYPEVKEPSQITNGIIDVSDVLQYWVVDGRLDLPMHETRWWRSAAEADVDEPDNTSWTWNWSLLIGRRVQTEEAMQVPSNGSRGTLTVRYQYSKSIYEVSFDGDELIWLPNTRATELGLAKRVS